MGRNGDEADSGYLGYGKSPKEWAYQETVWEQRENQALRQ